MKFIAHIKAFLKDEEGATGIEYALLGVMVAILIVAVTPGIRSALLGVFTEITNALNNRG
jgi:pilus assembly protein Flp/PilA